MDDNFLSDDFMNAQIQLIIQASTRNLVSFNKTLPPQPIPTQWMTSSCHEDKIIETFF